MLLKKLRFAIVKQFSSEVHLSKAALPSLCNCIDNAARAIARMCSRPPVLLSPHNPQASSKTGALISRIRQAAPASTEHDYMCTQPSDLHRKLAEKSRDLTLAKRYAKALEARLVLLEAEVTELRSEARLTSARNTRQLPLQGATSFSSTNWMGFIAIQPASHADMQRQNQSFPTSSLTHMLLLLQLHRCADGDTGRHPRRSDRYRGSHRLLRRLLRQKTGWRRC